MSSQVIAVGLAAGAVLTIVFARSSTASAAITLIGATAPVEAAPWWGTLVVLGGLIGSAITGAVTVFTGRTERAHDKQMRKEERDAASQTELRRERKAAYTELLTASMAIVQTASIMRLVMMTRSGLKEGVDIVMRLRKPVDPFEMGGWLRKDWDPLFAAWSHIWAIGSPEAVAKANRLLDTAVEVLGRWHQPR